MLKYAFLAVAIAFLVVIVGGLAPIEGTWAGRLIDLNSGGWREVSVSIGTQVNPEGFTQIAGEIHYSNKTYTLEGIKTGAWSFTLTWEDYEFACTLDPLSLLLTAKIYCKGTQTVNGEEWELKLWQ
jgi:hypothetical protein